MVTPNTPNAGAASMKAVPACTNCFDRAQREAAKQALDAQRVARIRRDRAARESYVPDADAEIYDGPLNEDGEPFPSSLHQWQCARAQGKPHPIVPTAGEVCGRALRLVAQLIDAGALDHIEGGQRDAVERQIGALVSDIETIDRAQTGFNVPRATSSRNRWAAQMIGGGHHA